MLALWTRRLVNRAWTATPKLSAVALTRTSPIGKPTATVCGPWLQTSPMSSHEELWGEESYNYSEYNRRRNRVMESLLNSPSRFQKIDEREDRSDLPAETIKAQYMGKSYITHRGCQLLKTTDDNLIFQQLLWYLRPATVIELGSYTGGSAIWMADMLRLMEIESCIYSMDHASRIEDQVRKIQPENVTFLTGDSNAIEKTFTEEFLSRMPHPWLVIEDAHTNIYGVLEHFSRFTKSGDYTLWWRI